MNLHDLRDLAHEPHFLSLPAGFTQEGFRQTEENSDSFVNPTQNRNFLGVRYLEVLLEFDEIHSNHLKKNIPHTARPPRGATYPEQREVKKIYL